MRKIASLFILLVVLATACQTSPPPTPTATPTGADPFDAVRAHIEQLVAEGEVPSMAVAIARNGEIIWEEGFVNKRAAEEGRAHLVSQALV